MPPKFSEYGEVFIENRQENIGYQIIAGFRSNLQIPSNRSLVDDVEDQPQESFRKVFPCVGSAV